MATAYNLDNAIDAFFQESGTTATRQQCDDFALARGAPVKPVPIQGTFSYTVLAGASKIFQFRVASSVIDIELSRLASATHGELVPSCTYHGTIGSSQPLSIYEMNNLPGTPYILARDTSIPQPLDSAARQHKTVRDLAKFFAQSYNNPPPRCPREPDTKQPLLTEFTSALTALLTTLPPRFTPLLTTLLSHLPTLFSTLPLVFTHGDLCEMNLLTDSSTGALTGIVDWAEARVLPFGFALYGFENVLGYMDGGGWHYFDNAAELREGFWALFREETGVGEETMEMVWVGRMVGLFYRYGFVFEGREVLGVVEEGGSGMRYLDAFCREEGWAQV